MPDMDQKTNPDRDPKQRRDQAHPTQRPDQASPNPGGNKIHGDKINPGQKSTDTNLQNNQKR